MGDNIADSEFPAPIVASPSATKRNPAYKLSIATAAAATSALCTLCWIIPLILVARPGLLTLITGLPLIFIFQLVLVLPVILAYRRLLRGPQVLDMIVAGAAAWFLTGLCGYLLSQLLPALPPVR